MSARDRYSYRVVCPKCGQTGVFHVSEDDHRHMRSPHREIDRIEGNFSATVEAGVKVHAVCNDCGTQFKR